LLGVHYNYDCPGCHPPIPPNTPGVSGTGHTFCWEPGAQVVGRSNYLGMGGFLALSASPDNARRAGVFTFRSAVSLAQVARLDGTSNTLMFGEYAGGWIDAGAVPNSGLPSGIYGSHWGAGFNYAGFGPPMANRTSDPKAFQWTYFSSQHTGAVNFSFCDGSVRSLGTEIDYSTWLALSGYQDGVVVTY
jgi:prepilin-type processing-associated H-X9-DG protein